VAEGSPIVLKIIVGGHVDAIVGVACLNVLEKAIDKILLAGIPCMAVPLLSSDCRNTSVDEEWVNEVIQVSRSEPVQQTRTYVHLMRAADGMFDPEKFDSLVPRLRGSKHLNEMNGASISSLDPITSTEAIAHDFLGKGGKYTRPFVTLAVYDALTGAKGTEASGARHLASYSDAIFRAALSIETFHKASLVHDDIEDDDYFRYGDETLHRKFGVSTAINVGDYLIGLGYRLVSREAAVLGPEAVSDMLDCLAKSHLRLAEGQGAELFWRDARDKRLTPADALKIYALKTAPAFEAAMYLGARLAGGTEGLETFIRQFSRHLGIAFQILNDLKDWEGDDHNKLLAGGDVLKGRPTVLWALALTSLSESSQEELEQLVNDSALSLESRFQRVCQLYREAGVFEKARQLVDRYQQRAEEVADEVEPDELRRLMYYMVDTILEPPAESISEVIMPTLGIAISPTVDRVS
jgi:geranylgeranyl pyrophosphate synthase